MFSLDECLELGYNLQALGKKLSGLSCPWLSLIHLEGTLEDRHWFWTFLHQMSSSMGDLQRNDWDTSYRRSRYAF